MSPEDVPADLVEKARASVPLLRLGMSTEEIARSVLAAVLPDVQALAWAEGYHARAYALLGPGGIPVEAPANPHLTAMAEGPT